jgi:hypothetical protein
MIKVKTFPRDIVKYLTTAITQTLKKLTDDSFTIAAQPKLPHFPTNFEKAPCRDTKRSGGGDGIKNWLAGQFGEISKPRFWCIEGYRVKSATLSGEPNDKADCP